MTWTIFERNSVSFSRGLIDSDTFLSLVKHRRSGLDRVSLQNLTVCNSLSLVADERVA